MAKDTESKARPTSDIVSDAPASDVNLIGFKNLNPEQAFGWFKKVAGGVCYGEYLGRFEKTWGDNSEKLEGETAFYHQIRIWRETMASVANPNGSGSSDKLAPIGSILNVDESKTLEAMKNLPDQNGGKHIVYIKYHEKVKIPGTARTFWKGEVKVKDYSSKDSPF
jgi:hypothetical protein